MATHFNSIKDDAKPSEEQEIYAAPIDINDTVPSSHLSPEETIDSRLDLVNGLLRQVTGSNRYFEIQPVDMRRFTSWPLSNIVDPIRILYNLGQQRAVLSDTQMIDILLDIKYFLINLQHAFDGLNVANDAHKFGYLNLRSSDKKYSYTDVPDTPATYSSNKIIYLAYPKDELNALKHAIIWSKSDNVKTGLSAKDKFRDAMRNAGGTNA